MSNNETMHTQMCNECGGIKRTGFSLKMHKKWTKRIGARHIIEASAATLTTSLDLELLHGGKCYGCREGVEIVEEVVMVGNQVEHVGVVK